MKNAEFIGKYQIAYLPTNRGINLVEVEKIDNYTDLRESSEGRFAIKFQIENTLDEVIDFVYREMLYISKEQATELVNDCLIDRS